MKNFTNNFKQFTSRLSARWLIMAFMLLAGTSSAWGAKTTLKQGETITFIFSQGDVPQDYGWNSTQLHIWDDSGNDETFDFNGQHVLVAGDWIPTNFQFISKYENSGWRGQTSDIGDCGGKAKLQPNTTYSVKLAGKDETDWIGSQWNTGSPNKQFKITLHCFADCTPTVTDQIIIKCKSSEKYVYAWVWDSDQKKYNGSTWPGNEITTTEDGYLVLKITTEKDLNVIFSDGQGNQTTDITGLKVGKEYTYNYNDKTYELTGLGCITPSCFTINDLDITASKTSICDGESVTLTLNNKQSGVTYKIGNTTIFNSNVAKPTYDTGAITGVSSKSYTITAEATNQCKSKSKKIDISINDLPETPQFDAAPSYCAGDEITLPTEDKAKNSVTWYDEQGTAAGTPANTAGPHTYKAKATNTSGCVSADYGTYQYTVKAKVGLAWNTISTSMPINTTQDITTTLTGTGDVVYTSSDNTVISVSGSTLKALKEGNATITATATGTGDYCGETTVRKEITVTCVRVNAPNVTASDICSGGTATLTLNNRQDGVTYKLNSTSGIEIFGSGNDTYTTLALNENTTYKIYASHANACTNNIEGSVTISVVSAPQTPSLSTNINMLNTTNTTATLTIGNYVEGVTYTLYKDNSSTGNTTTSTTFSVTAGGVYKVKGTNSNNPSGCQDTDFSNEITINVCPTPAKPLLTSNAVTTCNGNVTTFGSITITNMAAYKDDDYTFTLGGKTATPDANGRIVISSAANTEYTVTVTNSCGNPNSANVEIAINDKTPTISGATIAQPGKLNKIELTVPAGINAKWSVSPEADLSVTEGNSTMFSAETNGTYTITATNGTCSDTHAVTVADAFYIYFRNAKKGETAYANFYDPNQNTEEVQGGEMFYAECDALPTDATYTAYNEGGRKADDVKNDCDGYTWYGFKASDEVIAGTKYFYVHAKNDLNNGGWYTHTVPTKVTLTSDVYYTLCETSVNECNEGSKGWKIVSASAPYAGPKVHASGSTALGTNKFAALYVTDCSGKKVSSYQWEYCRTQAGTYDNYKASVSNSGTLYSGDAGKTNNIRPSVAGYYRCKVTYEDRSSLTSEPVQVTGAYSYTESSLPVFVVNTNGEGFPVNDCSGTPSKNADKMKEKVSVDVKIYKAGTMVYDRKARMNYRGSSSLNFLKKSYAFCPGKDNCVEDKGRQDYVKTEKMNMLNVGTAKDKDWVLYAAAPDPSLMRNRLVFDTFRDMTGKWSVNSCYVQLYVDGTYKGVYVLMDKITNNENRVNITHEDGFIVKFDKTDKVDRVGGYEGKLGDEKTFKTTRTGKDDIGTYDTSIDQRFEIEYPEKDDYPTGWSAKVNQIQGMFEAFENALAQGDFATVQKYIDYDSWADWFIISEYVKNVDTYRASNIFVYNGNKIEARPLWDQELSFNNQTNVAHKSNDATGLMATTASIYNNGAGDFPAPFWFTGGGANITGGLLSDPCFVQVVKEKWNKYSTGTGALTQDALNKKIEAYTTELGTAADISFNRGTMDCGSCNTGCGANGTGYSNSINKSGSIDAMETWIEYRGNNLTTALNNLKGASFSIQIIPSEAKTTPWEPVEIAVSVTPAGYDYKLEYTDNDLGSVANTIIKEEGDKITYRIPRPSAWGTGDAEEGARADIEYGIKATLSVQEGTTVCGSQAAPSSTGKIILQDEDNDNCK